MILFYFIFFCCTSFYATNLSLQKSEVCNSNLKFLQGLSSGKANDLKFCADFFEDYLQDLLKLLSQNVENNKKTIWQMITSFVDQLFIFEKELTDEATLVGSIFKKSFDKFLNLFDFTGSNLTFSSLNPQIAEKYEVKNLDILQYIECVNINDSQEDVELISLTDLHGSSTIIKSLRDYIFDENFLLKKPNQKYIFCGDYHDRGPCGEEVFLWLIGCKMIYPENFYVLKGNHEGMEYFFDSHNPYADPLSLFTRLIASLLPSMLCVKFPDGTKTFYCHGCVDLGLEKKNLDTAEKFIFLLPGFFKKNSFVFFYEFFKILKKRYRNENFEKVLSIYCSNAWPLMWCDWCFPDNKVIEGIYLDYGRGQLPFSILYNLFNEFPDAHFIISGHTHNSYTLNILIEKALQKKKAFIMSKPFTDLPIKFILQPPVMSGNSFELFLEDFSKKFGDQSSSHLIMPCLLSFGDNKLSDIQSFVL